MKQNLNHAIDLIFGHEGGISTRKDDPGNWSSGKVGVGELCGTKYGITGRTLGAFRKLGRAATLNEVRALTLAEAAQIIRKQYAEQVSFDDLPSGLDYAALDYAVNSGPGQAAKSLQRVVEVNRDMSIGAHTLEAIALIPIEILIDRYCDERLRVLKSLATWGTYGKGWAKRVSQVRGFAKAMAKGVQTKALGALEDGAVSASPNQRSVLKTAQGKTGALSAVALASNQAVEQLGAFQGSQIVGYVTAGLTFLGIGVTLYLTFQKIQNGEPA